MLSKAHAPLFMLHTLSMDAPLTDTIASFFNHHVMGLWVALASLSIIFFIYSLSNTRRHKANLAMLRRANALNDTILASTRHLIVATHTDGTVLYFNTTAEQALGYSRDEVVGRMTPVIWHDPLQIEQRKAELERTEHACAVSAFDVFVLMASKNGSHSEEWDFIRKDGSRFIGLLTVTCLHNDAGEISGYLGMIEDITQQKQQQEDLRTSEEVFKLAMEYASVGMAIVSPEGKWLMVNPAVCDILGYEESELLVMDFQRLSHPEDLAPDMEALTQLLKGTINNYQMEKRYFHKDGRIIWVLLSVSLVRASDGKPQFFISQLKDVTDRKTTELKLREARIFQELVKQNNPDILFVKDQDFRIVDANEAFLSMYPKELRHQIIGYTTIENYNPEEAKAFLENDREAFAKGYCEAIETIQFPNGVKQTIFTKKIRFHDSNGKPFILGIGRDITERERLVEELAERTRSLEQAYAQLADVKEQEKLASLGRVASGLAHEVNNALQPALGLGEFVQDRLAKEDFRNEQEYMDLIMQSVSHAKHILENILSYTHGIHAEAETCEPVSLIEKSLQFARTILPGTTRVHLNYQWPETMKDKMILCNRTEIAQVFVNLLKNASKATQHLGNISVFVHVGAHPEFKGREAVFIDIADDGCGIMPEHLLSIFEPFFTTSDISEGTGLGLWSVKNILDRHDGGITVKSVLGEGSTFTVHLPLRS